MPLRQQRPSPWNSQRRTLIDQWWPAAFAVLILVALISSGGFSGERDVETENARSLISTMTHDAFPVDSNRNDEGIAGVLERSGFKFARSTTEYILEASYARSAENKSLPLYSEHELRMIVRSLNTMRGFLNQGLWTGSDAALHYLGAGSCLVKLKQPAIDVAVASMHGIYLQKWRKHAYKGFYEKECDKRYRLRTVLGSQLEQALWLETAMFGNGPWSTCVTTYIKLLERNNTNPDPKVAQFLDEVPFIMLFCDEIEEAIGGEAILSGHWQRRDTKYFDDAVKLVTMLGQTQLAAWTRNAQEMSHAMLDPNQAYLHFQELTPPDHEHLFNTAKLNSEADALDLERWPIMVDITRHEQAFIPPFNKPTLLPKARKGIHQTRDMCDKTEAGEMTLDEYLDAFAALKQDVLKCEATDARFQNDMPMPKNVPKWAVPSNHPSFKED